MIYYFDFTKYETRTTEEQRLQVRKQMTREKRNKIMAYKLKLQRDQCFFCGNAIDINDHLDHLMPVYRGGKNNLANLVAACKSCNMIKMADQIEVTNQYTIDDYLNKKRAMKKWHEKIKKHPNFKRYQPKKVRLYIIHRADCFRCIKN